MILTPELLVIDNMLSEFRAAACLYARKRRTWEETEEHKREILDKVARLVQEAREP